jgi:response regulator RpfG family c-di-GMP phosphodiesterase
MISTQRAESPLGALYHWHTVLIVDDDPEILVALRRSLDREPYDVVTTDRPGLALEWMGRKNVSLAISDQLMPEMAGDEFLEEVWKKSPLTARLLLTGYPERVDRIPRSRRLLIRVMTKPWDDFELKRTIRNLLREREGATE